MIISPCFGTILNSKSPLRWHYLWLDGTKTNSSRCSTRLSLFRPMEQDLSLRIFLSILKNCLTINSTRCFRWAVKRSVANNLLTKKYCSLLDCWSAAVSMESNVHSWLNGRIKAETKQNQRTICFNEFFFHRTAERGMTFCKWLSMYGVRTFKSNGSMSVSTVSINFENRSFTSLTVWKCFRRKKIHIELFDLDKFWRSCLRYAQPHADTNVMRMCTYRKEVRVFLTEIFSFLSNNNWTKRRS